MQGLAGVGAGAVRQDQAHLAHLVRALVQQSLVRLSEVLTPMMKDKAPTVPGYCLRIVDGNHLPASEKRLKPLRGFRGAALLGHSLVVYDPDLDLVVDLVPCEDAHAQDRSLMQTAQSQAQPEDLWIVDCNFSTRRIFCGLHGRGSSFIVREHGCTPHPRAGASTASWKDRNRQGV